MVTAEVADNLYSMNKYIVENIEWKKDKNAQFRKRLDIPVYSEAGHMLKLKGDLYW